MASHPDLSRRRLLHGLATGLAVIGYSPLHRLWITEASAAECDFVDAPPLDGVLLTDTSSREGHATDLGNIVRHTPCAVLRPGSVEDIQRMIRFCRQHRIRVAARGQGHTTHGQGLTTGLIIELGVLNTIHSIGPDGADVDAGVTWKDLVTASVAQGLTPPVLTGYTQLSVGGTLSVGGISPGYNQGAQVDRVQSLEVVTGRGNIRTCSADQRPQLFEAVLAGLGQCAVITRATVDLVRARRMARRYTLTYANNAVFFHDLRILINRGEIPHVFNLWIPGGPGGWTAQLQAIAFYDPARPPQDAFLLRGLSQPPSAAVIDDTSYLDYILNVDVLIDFFSANFGWRSLIKPWFDVWLPDSTVESYVDEVLPTLTPDDVGPLGFLLLFPERRSRFTRSAFRVPPASGGEFVYLFDILTASPTPGPDPTYVDHMLRRNRRLFERARGLGGTRYPIGAIEFTGSDWVEQYGEFWPELSRRKNQYDPDHILTPGPGIF
jgi:FAD/FMN-containing dehydrogenase